MSEQAYRSKMSRRGLRHDFFVAVGLAGSGAWSCNDPRIAPAEAHSRYHGVIGEKEKPGKDSHSSAACERSRTWANDFIVPKTLRSGVDGNRYRFVAGRRLGKAALRNRMRFCGARQ
jgi:hypothetical protein